MQKQARPQKDLQSLRTMAMAKPSSRPLRTWQVNPRRGNVSWCSDRRLLADLRLLIFAISFVAFCSRDGGKQ